MTGVTDGKDISRANLGDIAVQQWELFRRIKEGTLDPKIIETGLRVLTFGEGIAGVKFGEYGGFRIRLSRNTLKSLAEATRADGSKVIRRTITAAEREQHAVEIDKTVFEIMHVRVATWTEALSFIVKQKPARKKWGLIGIMGTHWNISFEEWDSEITVTVADRNWQHLSGWRAEECLVLVVPEQKSADSALCTCPKECDCQNPPPDGWGGTEGVYHISNQCPVHNHNPLPSDICPIHGDPED